MNIYLKLMKYMFVCFLLLVICKYVYCNRQKCLGSSVEPSVLYPEKRLGSIPTITLLSVASTFRSVFNHSRIEYLEPCIVLSAIHVPAPVWEWRTLVGSVRHWWIRWRGASKGRSSEVLCIGICETHDLEVETHYEVGDTTGTPIDWSHWCRRLKPV